MQTLLRLCWRLTLMRASPADMPGSPALLMVLVIVSVSGNILARLLLAEHAVGVAVTGTCVGMGAWALVIAALLRFKSVPERFQQTLSALLGIDIIITVLSALPLLLARWLTLDAAVLGFLQALFMTFFVWDMLAKGAVYRQAFNIGPGLGNLLALCFSFGFIYLDSLLMPATSAVTGQ